MLSNLSKLFADGMTVEQVMDVALAGIEYDVFDELDVEYLCDCSRERTEQVLIALGKTELAKLAEEDPQTEVCCHFCDKKYVFSSDELNDLIKRI